MRVKGSGLIKAIKAHSAVVNNPNVYVLAVLPLRLGQASNDSPTNVVQFGVVGGLVGGVGGVGMGTVGKGGSSAGLKAA